ncbi:MAG: B-box zinc finger protein [Halobacteriota archaeon]
MNERRFADRCPECDRHLPPCRECSTPYCGRCDEHVHSEDGAIEVLTDTNASEIARSIGTLASPADETGLAFGSAFESAYSHYWYRRRKGGYDGYGSLKHAYYPKRTFSKRIAAELRERNVYSDDRVAHAVRLFSAFLAADVRGLTPATKHRRAGDHVVYAKPDLERLGGSPDLIEFKTAPIDDYARVQATVMAWVFDRPVRLVGARTDPDTGWVSTEETICEPSRDPVDAFRKL